MNKKFCSFAFTGALALLALAPVSQAGMQSAVTPEVILPGDTFSFSVAGYDSSGMNGVYLISPLTGKFGSTLTLSGTGAGGAQTVTVTATQTIGATTTTDSISIGVPANFVPAGTTNGAGGVINFVELDLGGYAAGADPLNFLTPVISPTYAGSINYGTNGASVLTLTPASIAANSVFDTTNTALYTAEAISTTSTAGLSQFALRTFNFSITYANVPEPSTYAFMGLGALALGVTVLRKRQQLSQTVTA